MEYGVIVSEEVGSMIERSDPTFVDQNAIQ